MFQLPVNNLTRLRKARKRVKRLLGDIGLDFCKEHVEEYKEFCPDESYEKHFHLDVCLWDPSWTKSQGYRTKQFCCSECPFASKYFSAYKNHFRNVHREDFENRILLNCSYCMYSGNKRTLETHVRLFHMPQNVVRQGIASPQGAVTAGRGSVRMEKPVPNDKKELPVYYCKKCNHRDRLYNVVRRHIYREHFQHVATPYVGKNTDKQDNESAPVNTSSHGIRCKSCPFLPRSYEALVQHVIEYHERIGHQVTAMIGHTNVIVARSQTPVNPAVGPHMVQPVNRFNMPKGVALPVGNHYKQGGKGNPAQPVCITLPDKAQFSGAVAQSHAGKHVGGFGIPSPQGNASFAPSAKSLPHATPATLTKKAAANALNTSQTQKWKICTICNELFPESAYSAHFEKEHQAEKIQAMAKYIMKIHNFTSKCLYCNRYLPSDTLLNHMLVHGLTCPQCHSTFYEVEKMVAHKRQVHCNEPAEPATGSPLTFDLTLQQGNPKNVQLIITTYNMKDAPETSSTTAQPPNSAVSRPSLLASKGQEKPTESLVRNASQKREVGKTLCPLCFTILKGPISDALAHHLRDRHQVLQTLHPVEKKLTYKCIHCLGVYTSNMTASTITLHLVHCRGVGQAAKVQGSKSISPLKRELVAPETSYPKKRKLMDQNRYYPTTFVEKPDEPVVLALDPKGHADASYDARKSFLTAYFHQRPYPSQREIEKLAASLWLWKSDVSSHFTNRRRSCERDLKARKPAVLLGFNMRAVSQLEHYMNFDPDWLFTVSNEDKSGVSRTSKIKPKTTPSSEDSPAVSTGQSSQSNCAFKPGSYLEPISIDSDSESEKEQVSENADAQAETVAPPTGQPEAEESVEPKGPVNDSEVTGNCIQTETKSSEVSGSGSSPEEAAWSDGLSPDERHYNSAGEFKEKGKEVSLLGR